MRSNRLIAGGTIKTKRSNSQDSEKEKPSEKPSEKASEKGKEKMIGKGSYGCAFYPAEHPLSLVPLVLKLKTEESMTNEFQIRDHIIKHWTCLEPYTNFFLLPLQDIKCDLDKTLTQFGDRCPSNIPLTCFYELYGGKKLLSDENVKSHLSPLEKVGVTYRLIMALKFLFEMGIRHKDLNVGKNTILDEHNRPRILDFGEAEIEQDMEKDRSKDKIFPEDANGYDLEYMILDSGYDDLYLRFTDNWKINDEPDEEGGVDVYVVLLLLTDFLEKNGGKDWLVPCTNKTMKKRHYRRLINRDL